MRRRFLLMGLAGVIGALVATLPILTASAAPAPPMTGSVTTSDFAFAADGGGNTVTIAPGGTVNFSYPSGSSRHNVDFGSGPQPTSCTLGGSTQSAPIPSAASSPGWSGSCTFDTAGTYTFHCDLHTFMTGTVVVTDQATTTTDTQPAGSTTAPGTTTTGPTTTMTMTMPMNMPMPTEGGSSTTKSGPSQRVKPSPFAGSTGSAVKLVVGKGGAQVRGTIRIAQAARGGHAAITVLASRAAIRHGAPHGQQLIALGSARLSHLRPGTAQFKVAVKQTARRALTTYRRLTATVRITVTAPGTKTATLTRTIVLRA